jgi:hypothetical protein
VRGDAEAETFAQFIPEEFQGYDLPIRIGKKAAEEKSSHRASPTLTRSKAEMVTPFLAAQIHVKGLLRKPAVFMRCRECPAQQSKSTSDSRKK